MNKKLDRKKQKQVHRYVRATIQLIFFLLVPSAFTAAFSGVKYLFTQIGKGDAIGMTSFVTALCVLCLYTILFGRFFCGFACAFGSFGDALHGIYLWICKKNQEKTVPYFREDHKVFIFAEIHRAGYDQPVMLCRRLCKNKGHQSVGSFFHDPCRKLQTWRICHRDCTADHSDDRHVCAGTLFLPFFLSDGCSLFPASGTAVPDTGKRP